MRKVTAYFSFIILMLQSCHVGYRQVHVELMVEDNMVITKETKLKQTGRNCFSKEITMKKDAVNQQLTYKEVVTYNCSGAYSYEVKRKTWTLVNGKEVVTVLKK